MFVDACGTPVSSASQCLTLRTRHWPEEHHVCIRSGRSFNTCHIPHHRCDSRIHRVPGTPRNFSMQRRICKSFLDPETSSVKRYVNRLVMEDAVPARVPMAFPATSRSILFSMVSRAAVAFLVRYTPRLRPLRFKAASSGSGTKCGMVWLVR